MCMTLKEYINSFPRSERMAVRQRIAKALVVTEPCVRHYANGQRDIPSKHFKSIVKECEGVEYGDLLPEESSAPPLAVQALNTM